MSYIMRSREAKSAQRSTNITQDDSKFEMDHTVHIVVSQLESKNHNSENENEEIENTVESKSSDNGDDDEDEDEVLLSELRLLSRTFTATGLTKRKKTCEEDDHHIEEQITQKKSVKEFDNYYQKSFSNFLQKKKDDLDKLKKQQEEAEASELRHKPNLVSKQQKMKHIPIADRIGLIKAKKEREILKMKKEQEEKKEKELSQLTFMPKINRPSKSPVSVRKETKEIGITTQKSHPEMKRQSENRTASEEAFKPKINKNSENLVKGMNDGIPTDVVHRLYSHAQANENKKKELTQKFTPNFKPQINTSSHKVIRHSTEVSDHVKDRPSYEDLIKTRLLTEKSKSPVNSRKSTVNSLTQNSRSSLGQQDLRPKKLQEGLGDNQPRKESLYKVTSDYLNKKREEKPQLNKSINKSAVNISTQTVESKKDVTPNIENKKNSMLFERDHSKDNSRAQSPSIQKSRSSISMVNNIKDSQTLEKKTSEIVRAEEIEIAHIKQNLMNIKDNLQTLKDSFKKFKYAQPIPKAHLAFVETPKKEKDASVDNKVSTKNVNSEKKISTRLNTLPNENASVNSRKENLPEGSSYRTHSPICSTPLKKTPERENGTKSNSPSPIRSNKAEQCSSSAKKPMKMRDPNIQKHENKKERGSPYNKSPFSHKQDNLGQRNTSLPSTRESPLDSRNGQRKQSNTSKISNAPADKSNNTKKEDSFGSWKCSSEAEGSLNSYLDSSQAMSVQKIIPKNNENHQTLKEIAEITLRKFKGLDKGNTAEFGNDFPINIVLKK